MWMRVFPVIFALAACAGPEQHAASTESKRVSVEPEAKTVTVEELTITRPDGWRFASADDSQHQNAELMLLGPAVEDGRGSISFFRNPLNAQQKRVQPDLLLTLFAEQAVQVMEGELSQEPAYAEIAGRPGASATVRVPRLDADGRQSSIDGTVYGIVSDDSFWTVLALDPEGSGTEPAVNEVISSLRM